MEYVVKWSFKKGRKNNIYRVKENKITEFTTNRFLLMVILKDEFQVEVIANGKSQMQKGRPAQISVNICLNKYWLHKILPILSNLKKNLK